MSTGEQLADRPEHEPDDPISVIETFRANSQGLQATVERLVINPTAADLVYLKTLTGQISYGIDIFSRTGFFRNTKDKLTVSAGVSAMVDGLRSVIVCIDKVDPVSTPAKVILGVQGLETPKILVSTARSSEVDVQWEDADQIDKFADIILAETPEDEDSVSKTFVDAAKDAYRYLDTKLQQNSAIVEFINKKERKKDSMKHLGGVAAAALAGTLLANLISRKRK